METERGGRARPDQNIDQIEKMVIGMEQNRRMLENGQAARRAITEKQSRDLSAKLATNVMAVCWLGFTTKAWLRFLVNGALIVLQAR